MKFYLSIISLIILGIGCQNKEIKIPVSNAKGIQEMSNFSEIWMFLEVEANDTILKLNDNNLIGSTNWIFNIDKSLKLKKIIPVLSQFQEKRIKKSMHNIQGFQNYLSYSDTISKVLSFVDISKVKFHFDTIQSKQLLLKNLDYYKNYNNIHVSFGINQYYINENTIQKEEFFKTLEEYIDFTKTDLPTLVHLNFNQLLSYQEYVYIKTTMLATKDLSFNIDINESIFDANKIPECGCEL